MNSKLPPKRFQLFKGLGGLDTGKVYSTIYGKSYDDLDDNSKAKWEKAYKKNQANLDKLYWQKRELIHANAAKYPSFDQVLGNPLEEARQQREQEMIASRNRRSLQQSYEYLNSGRPDGFDATADWNNRIAQMDENQQLEETIKAAPEIRLAQLRINNSIGVNKPVFSGSVKHTANDKYYESLISKANETYGSNFKTREDVAAFQKQMGAKAVDGIIGPETEAMLSGYFGIKSGNGPVNTRRMYKGATNEEVTNRTFDAMLGKGYDSDKFSTLPQDQTPPERFSKYVLAPKLYNYRFTIGKKLYMNPYTRHLRNTYTYSPSINKPVVGPMPQ